MRRRPLYLQATDDLKALLDERNYQIGEALPSAEKLAKHLGVSRATLREALAYLEQQGRVVRRQGVGTFVTRATGAHLLYGLEQLTSFRSLAAAAGLDFETIERDVSIVEPDSEQSALFNMQPGAQLARVQWVPAFDGTRVAYIDSLIPANRIDFDTLLCTEASLLEFLTRTSRNQQGSDLQ